MELQQSHHKLLVGIALLCAVSSPCMAEKLDVVVQETASTNPEILKQSARRFAQNSQLRESLSGYFPTIDIAASFGRDNNENFFTRLNNPGSGDETLTKREAGFLLTQMLFDGFAVRSEVEADTAKVQGATFNVLATLENVILQVSASYIDTIMLRSIYMHSKDNMLYYQDLVDQIAHDKIDNLKQGDKDLIKSRLLRAHTQMLDVQRQVRDSQADYIKSVGQKPGVMYRPETPEKILPVSEDSAVAVAIKNNPRIFRADADVRVARAEKRHAKANYFPRFDLELSGTNNNNVDGYDQNTNSLSAMLLMKYNLFRGGKDIANEKKSAWMLEATKEELNETTRVVEQNMRHVWSAFINYKGKLAFLKDRVDTLQMTRDSYSKEFLDGKRASIDLLDAADELYAAKVEFVVAQYKELLSRYMILQGMGKIHNFFNVTAPGSTPCETSKWLAGF